MTACGAGGCYAADPRAREVKAGGLGAFEGEVGGSEAVVGGRVWDDAAVAGSIALVLDGQVIVV